MTYVTSYVSFTLIFVLYKFSVDCVLNRFHVFEKSFQNLNLKTALEGCKRRQTKAAEKNRNQLGFLELCSSIFILFFQPLNSEKFILKYRLLRIVYSFLTGGLIQE